MNYLNYSNFTNLANPADRVDSTADLLTSYIVNNMGFNC